MTERPDPPLDVRDPALLSAWGQCWVNRNQPYAVQQEDGSYRWVYAPCDAAVLAAHLAGEHTIALSSLNETGTCRWVCLDADEADALPSLLTIAAMLTDHGLPGLVEASRRGGHLWLLLDAPVSAVVVRRVVLYVIAELCASGLSLPPLELYPDTEAPRALGHAVRLPLGVHQLTGRRYALFDDHGYPCAFTTTEAAVRFVLTWPRISTTWIGELAATLPASDGEATEAHRQSSNTGHDSTTPTRVGTHSSVIRWVDVEVSPLDLLADLAPESELRAVGRGYLGWCPFHDDRAPDEAGKPGTPSFYVVHDRRHGWSWRCFSSNCPQSWGPMRHTFELFQRLLGLTVRSAIVEACQRWPEANGRIETTATERTG